MECYGSPIFASRQYLESVNMDRAARLRAWKAGGGSRPRPRPRLLPTGHDFKTVSLWAVVIQLTGMLGFNLATIGSIIDAAILVDVRRLCPGSASYVPAYPVCVSGVCLARAGHIPCLPLRGQSRARQCRAPLRLMPACAAAHNSYLAGQLWVYLWRSRLHRCEQWVGLHAWSKCQETKAQQ